MAGELVLLTGGTGFLGYTILVDLLQHGYRVRVAARSHEKIAKVRAAPSIVALDPTAAQLMFVIVPDMAALGAYDEAVQDVDFIIHAAAPLHADHASAVSGSDSRKVQSLEDAFVTACVQGNLGILQSARDKGKAIRRIVMTSFTVAIAPADFFSNAAAVAQMEGGEEVIRGPEARIPVPEPPYNSQLHAYCAARTASLEAAETFANNHTLRFDLISIMPSLIFGKDELATDTDSTRMLMYRLLPQMPSKAPVDGDTANNTYQGEIVVVGNAVLCTDVARAHVRALDPIVKGTQSFVLNTDARWEDTVPITKAHFPDPFDSGVFWPGGPKWFTVPLRWDTTKVRDVLGVELATYDAKIKEVVDEYLEKAGSRHG
ncbi:NAD(P)-binding protein [Apiospora aurea]|uniref:NAD(P)-binding protein n=1 Tax=Apiospora aurea TaxID=335848 RepID=A0ABR1Q337_9PEZI